MKDRYQDVHPVYSDIDKELAVKQLFGLAELIEDNDNDVIRGNLTVKHIIALEKMTKHCILYCRNTRKALANEGWLRFGPIVTKTLKMVNGSTIAINVNDTIDPLHSVSKNPFFQ